MKDIWEQLHINAFVGKTLQKFLSSKIKFLNRKINFTIMTVMFGTSVIWNNRGI